MKIHYLESVDSTQTYLKYLLQSNKITTPYAVVTNKQTNGIGSRDNKWKGMDGNLFLSFAMDIDDLPSDLKLESASIYFAYILKSTLEELGSNIWLKWPNDFYINEKKIGGMITNLFGNALVCGVGLNLVRFPENFDILDITINKEKLLNLYFKNIEKKPLWKQVFSKYKLEFYRNQEFFTHNDNLRISLGEAELQSDGSIMVNKMRIYSLR